MAECEKQVKLTLVGVVVDCRLGGLDGAVLGPPPLGRVELALSPDVVKRGGLLVAAVVVEPVVG